VGGWPIARGAVRSDASNGETIDHPPTECRSSTATRRAGTKQSGAALCREAQHVRPTAKQKSREEAERVCQAGEQMGKIFLLFIVAGIAVLIAFSAWVIAL
jgi:hypothetical protein